MDEMVAFLARGLRAHGFKTAVLHTVGDRTRQHSRNPLARMLSASGVEVVALAEASGRSWMRKWGPDVISAHGALQWVLDESGSSAVPYVDVLHGPNALLATDWVAEARRNRGLAAIVTVSEQVRAQYLRGAPDFPGDRIVAISNGVDRDRRRRVTREDARAALGLDDEFLFVCLARHSIEKNTFAVVSAFEDVAARHSNAHLLVAGRAEDPVYCLQVRKLRDSCADRDRIHLREYFADPGLVLSAADGLVINSFCEGWPLASMEALCAGVPVIASDVGGAREQLGDDACRGRLIAHPLGDPLAVTWKRMRAACYERQFNRAELVRAMSELVGDRAHWSDRREDLAAESAARFDPDRCAGGHAALLLSVIHDPLSWSAGQAA